MKRMTDCTEVRSEGKARKGQRANTIANFMKRVCEEKRMEAGKQGSMR